MLYWIYQFWKEAFAAENARGVEGWAHTFDALNLFRYITFRAAVACLLAFSISLMIGPRVIRKLISLKLGQPIRTAAEAGKLDTERYEGYLKLEDEIAKLRKQRKKRQMTVERRNKRDHKIKARNRVDREDIERDLKPRA
jgi:hypothetical protein